MLVILCCLLILVGCSSIIKEEPVHDLFSNDKYKYSLLIVDETGEYDITDELREKHHIRSFNTVQYHTSLEGMNNSYKFLELEKAPAFVVFDMNGVVFKTYSEDELITFLQNNRPNE